MLTWVGRVPRRIIGIHLTLIDRIIQRRGILPLFLYYRDHLLGAVVPGWCVHLAHCRLLMRHSIDHAVLHL